MDYDKEVPSDVVFEILTRTPSTKTLDTCKSVCKEWNQLIYDSSFRRTYTERMKSLQGYFVRDLACSKILFKSQQGAMSSSSNIRFGYNTTILAACNQGILVCKRGEHRKDEHYVCKPTTGQWQQIPNPNLHYWTVSFAIMILPSIDHLHYKIIRISESLDGISEEIDDHYKYRVEIFDSKDWCWSEKQELPLPYDEFIESSPAVTARNSVYWLTNHDNVVSYCMDKDNSSSFFTFSLPEQVENNTSKQLLEYHGKLGFVSLTEDESLAELWLLVAAKENLWAKKMVINLESLDSHDPSPTGCYNADLAFMKSFGVYVFYRLQGCGNSVVKVQESITAREIFQFRSDLEPVNLSPGMTVK